MSIWNSRAVQSVFNALVEPPPSSHPTCQNSRGVHILDQAYQKLVDAEFEIVWGMMRARPWPD